MNNVGMRKGFGVYNRNNYVFCFDTPPPAPFFHLGLTPSHPSGLIPPLSQTGLIAKYTQIP